MNVDFNLMILEKREMKQLYHFSFIAKLLQKLQRTLLQEE